MTNTDKGEGTWRPASKILKAASERADSKECGDCKGSGKVAGKTCIECSGTGRIQDTLSSRTPRIISAESQK